MIPVATAFLLHGGEVLLLKRPASAPSYPGMWSAVSGRIEPGESPTEAAVREVAEETSIGISRDDLLAMGEPFEIDGYYVFPQIFATVTRHVVLCDENEAYRWVKPAEIRTLDTVPLLEESFFRSLPPAD